MCRRLEGFRRAWSLEGLGIVDNYEARLLNSPEGAFKIGGKIEVESMSIRDHYLLLTYVVLDIAWLFVRLTSQKAAQRG